MSHSSLCTLVICAAVAVAPCALLGAGAAWQTDGVVVSAVAGSQEIPCIASLGADGAVIAWADARSGQYDIYAQKLNAQGQPVWTPGGVLVCGATYDQQFASIVPDGSGGVIVAWQDGRLGDDGVDIYAQRILPDGTMAWQAGGVPVCTHPPDLADPPTAFAQVMVGDESGGCIVVWRDTRNDPVTGFSEIYAQKISSAGAAVWAVNGVKVEGFTNPKWTARSPVACPDGSGGAMIVWQDARNASTTGNDLYMQRLNTSGTALWAANGIPLCQIAGDQGYADVIRLDSGDFIVTWEDKRSGNYDVYVQAVDAVGNGKWGTNGKVAMSAANDQRTPRVAPLGTLEMVIAWSDGRGGASTPDIYAQRLSSTGAPLWDPAGIAVCTAAGWQGRVRTCPGASGHTLITWMDNRVDPTGATLYYDIYSQILTANGATLLAADGAPVTTAPGTQRLQNTVEDASGGAYVVWEDNRNAGDWDIYAQRMTPPTSAVPVNSITDAKSRADGTVVSLPARQVTAAFSGFLYIEEADRSSGIRVESTQTVSPGDMVVVIGALQTSAERSIAATSVVVQ